MAITLKNEHDIAQMRVACKLASEVLDYITPFVAAGITTGELDRLCHEYMLKEQGTVPAPLNYQPPGYPPYPKATCISVNDVICHGIPGDKTLKNGDALNIDITVIKEGYFGDTSRMFIVGDIGYAIQKHAEGQGYSVVREYCGHGIGTVFHEDPQILHYGRPGTGLELQAGMIFTIEPMINAGRRDIRTMPDQWTVKTKDRSLSAQWEHTVLVTETGYDVLTVSAGTPARPPVVAATA